MWGLGGCVGDWVGDGVGLGGGIISFRAGFKRSARSDLMKNPNLQKTPITHREFELKFPNLDFNSNFGPLEDMTSQKTEIGEDLYHLNFI